jgi:tRNA A37 threonylcarbamoyladenosine dehydratase
LRLKSSCASNSPEIIFFLVEQGVARIRKATVVIIGCGGVDSL